MLEVVLVGLASDVFFLCIECPAEQMFGNKINFTVDVSVGRFQSMLRQSTGGFDELRIVHYHESLQRSVRSLATHRACFPSWCAKDFHRSRRSAALPECI